MPVSRAVRRSLALLLSAAAPLVAATIPVTTELDEQGLWPILDVSTNTPGVWFGVEDLKLVGGAARD